MRGRVLLLLIALGWTATGCDWLRGGAGGVQPIDKLKNLAQFEEVYALTNPTPTFGWMVGTGKVHVEGDGLNLSLGASLKLRRDSLVWLRLTKLMEVARLQASIDKLEIINRLEQKYQHYGYAQLAGYLSPTEGFSAVQRLSLGQIPFALEGARFGSFDAHYELETGDSIKQKALVNKHTLKLILYELDAGSYGKAVISLEDYRPTEYGLVPHKMHMEMTKGAWRKLDLEYSKVTFVAHEKADFEVPASYLR